MFTETGILSAVHEESSRGNKTLYTQNEAHVKDGGSVCLGIPVNGSTS